MTTDQLVAPAMMATRLEYCVQVKEKEETGLVDTFLDTSEASMQWKNSSSSADSAVRMDSFFLKCLTVNPTEFSQTEVPQEWSTVVLLALYYGNELNEVTTTNKSIWYSVHNKIAFAIVCNSVRGAAQTNFQKLQLRASKSKLMFGQKNQKGMLPVQPVETDTVRFEPQKQRETMAKFLQMPEKVQNIFDIKRCSHSHDSPRPFRTVEENRIHATRCLSPNAATRFPSTPMKMN